MIVTLYCRVGYFSTALAARDLSEVGIDWDHHVHRARSAAGLTTYQADVLDVAPRTVDRLTGLIALPPRRETHIDATPADLERWSRDAPTLVAQSIAWTLRGDDRTRSTIAPLARLLPARVDEKLRTAVARNAVNLIAPARWIAEREPVWVVVALPMNRRIVGAYLDGLHTLRYRTAGAWRAPLFAGSAARHVVIAHRTTAPAIPCLPTPPDLEVTAGMLPPCTPDDQRDHLAASSVPPTVAAALLDGLDL